ncbi:Uncharacterized protein At5g41620 [Linum grandiflorum]
MEGKEGDITEHCKIRKRGNSSNSSSSSLVQSYRFKRAILLGKRSGAGGGGTGGGSSTPVRMMAAAAAESAACRRGDDSVFSARKLAATVWEMNEVEHFSGRRKEEEEEEDGSEDSEEMRSRDGDKKSDPSPLLEDGTDRRRNSQRRRRSSSAVTKNMLQLADYNPSLMEVESQAKMGKAQMECVAINTKTKLKDISNGLLTSKELLKVMNRLWGFDNDQTSSSGMSLLSALKSEIDRARIQVNQLIKDQRSSRHEIDNLITRFEEEKAVWRSKERARIRNAISCISEELETEKKLRKQTERLNKRLGTELAETKAALRRVKEELETEKRAKEILEQVCDELASGVGGEDRDIVEEVKRETAKVREEVEKEREMLLLADVLREERVQMKLSEAKYLFEEKNAAVDRLKNELECYLMNGRRDGDESRPDYDRIKELEDYLKEIEFGALQKPRESLDRNDDDSGEESELHSIELSMNNKTCKWSFEGIVLDNPKRISVDKDLKGIEWGSISLYKKDSDAINHGIQQILDKERQLSGSGEDERRKSSVTAKSLRDLLLLSGSRRESSAQSTSGNIPLQELSNIGDSDKNVPDFRVVGVKGERRLSTSSK